MKRVWSSQNPFMGNAYGTVFIKMHRQTDLLIASPYAPPQCDTLRT